MAIAAVVVALGVAAPELAPPAGAALARSANGIEMQSQPATHGVLVAKKTKRRKAAAKRKAKLAKYIKSHPGALKSLKGKKLTLKQKLKAKAALKKHAKKKKKKTAAAARAAQKKSKRKKVGAVALAANTKKNKNAGKGHPLGTTGYLEILLLALLPFAVVALVLCITDYQRTPRAPSPQRRRRTLVITPMSRNR